MASRARPRWVVSRSLAVLLLLLGPSLGLSPAFAHPRGEPADNQSAELQVYVELCTVTPCVPASGFGIRVWVDGVAREDPYLTSGNGTVSITVPLHATVDVAPELGDDLVAEPRRVTIKNIMGNQPVVFSLKRAETLPDTVTLTVQVENCPTGIRQRNGRNCHPAKGVRLTAEDENNPENILATSPIRTNKHGNPSLF